MPPLYTGKFTAPEFAASRGISVGKARAILTKQVKQGTASAWTERVHSQYHSKNAHLGWKVKFYSYL